MFAVCYSVVKKWVQTKMQSIIFYICKKHEYLYKMYEKIYIKILEIYVFWVKIGDLKYFLGAQPCVLILDYKDIWWKSLKRGYLHWECHLSSPCLALLSLGICSGKLVTEWGGSMASLGRWQLMGLEEHTCPELGSLDPLAVLRISN